MGETDNIEAFIARWSHASGRERANDPFFITELCSLRALPLPEPACDDTRDNAYVFERRVTFADGDGSSRHGFIDCNRCGQVVLEVKTLKATRHTEGFDGALTRDRAQANVETRGTSRGRWQPA